MRVGLDISIQGRSQPTGVERLQATLIDALLRRDDDLQLHLLTHGEVPARWLGQPRVVPQLSLLRPTWIWRELAVPAVARQARLTLLHSPVVALARAVPCPQLATVHELPWADDDGGLGDRRWRQRLALARTVRRAARLICVSERTARQLTSLHPVCAPRVLTLPNAVDPRFVPGPDDLPPSRRPPTVLAVGRLRAKKNLGRLLEALSALPGVRLEIAGPAADAERTLRRRAARPDLRGRVHFAGFLSEEELLRAYRSARCVAFPSLFEGFGLPVLEAMAVGTPVLAARQGAAPEALGEAAWLVDGRSTRELTEGLRRVLDDDRLADDLAARGRRHAATRGADRWAGDVVAIWRQLG